jgi:pullulanase
VISIKKYPVYPGKDLGASYSREKTSFKVWAPSAEKVDTLFFTSGAEDGPDGNSGPEKTLPMTKDAAGVWTAEALGDIKNTYYVYRVYRNGAGRDAVDPYAKAVGVNGNRGMVADPAATDPAGFREHAIPPLASPVNALIYELHIRDLSMHPHSFIVHKGKFLGLCETGTKNTFAGPPGQGLSTGLDHIKELGVTHIHLLPVFDFKTVDESSDTGDLFNWGYDPQNYNVPEGSYARDPYKGSARIFEFKQMVQAVHKAGLRIIMDVVYNHLFDADTSNFTILEPLYFFRTDGKGRCSNGSACGNETASDHPMMGKFIADSVRYWAEEYRIDGFRFDLMGLHDIDTMNGIRAELDKIDPSILTYGEGWTAGPTPLPEKKRAIKKNAPLVHERIGFFSDDIRDGIKGSVFIAADSGFVNSKGYNGKNDDDVKFGIAASVEHSGVDIDKVHYSRSFWARAPSQTINYVSAHDNLSLWDKLAASMDGADEADLLKANKLAAAIVLTSQGIPFFQAGEEMARTKGGDNNSYKSPDSVNMLDWDRKGRFIDLFEYYKGLIQLRKSSPLFTLRTAGEIRNNLRFLDTEPGIIAYTLGAAGAVSPAEKGPCFLAAFNGTNAAKEISIPKTASVSGGEWDALVDQYKAGTTPLFRAGGDTVLLNPVSALILRAAPYPRA